MQTVVITRPVSQATTLAERLRTAGYAPLLFPALTIAPVADPEPLQRALSQLAAYRCVIFVSPNAIHAAISGMTATWPENVAIGVMGPGSIEALVQHGITSGATSPGHHIISPALHEGSDARFDSDSLFEQLDAELDLKTLRGERALIIKGNGGRPWLAQRLEQAGLIVEQVESYRRSPHVPDTRQQTALRHLIENDSDTIWIVTSSEAIAYLFESVDEIGGAAAQAWLRACRWLVPHQRIAENATARGVTQLILSGPGDVNIVAALTDAKIAPH